jgi:hypothetical protein
MRLTESDNTSCELAMHLLIPSPDTDIVNTLQEESQHTRRRYTKSSGDDLTRPRTVLQFKRLSNKLSLPPESGRVSIMALHLAYFMRFSSRHAHLEIVYESPPRPPRLGLRVALGPTTGRWGSLALKCGARK